MANDSGAEHEKPSLKRGAFFSRQRLTGPTVNHYDWALLVCCFVTGLVDAASFSNFGTRPQVSMQLKLC